jgi:hypothetical protein
VADLSVKYESARSSCDLWPSVSSVSIERTLLAFSDSSGSLVVLNDSVLIDSCLGATGDVSELAVLYERAVGV